MFVTRQMRKKYLINSSRGTANIDAVLQILMKSSSSTVKKPTADQNWLEIGH